MSSSSSLLSSSLTASPVVDIYINDIYRGSVTSREGRVTSREGECDVTTVILTYRLPYRRYLYKSMLSILLVDIRTTHTVFELLLILFLCFRVLGKKALQQHVCGSWEDRLLRISYLRQLRIMVNVKCVVKY